MKRIDTCIPGVAILQNPIYRDDRGYFQEIYNERALHQIGVDYKWTQDNLSVSNLNVVRGLHYQLIQPQTKLIRVVRGAVFDVAVDIRRASPTFGQHVSVELKAGDGQAFLIPAGFAHGFVALQPETIFLYKVDNFYEPKGDRTILWNDPALGIAWPVTEETAVLSSKDMMGCSFNSVDVFL